MHKILVLEDHPAIHDYILKAVNELNLDIRMEFTTNSEDALLKLKSNLPPDYFISDIQLNDRKVTIAIETASIRKIPFMVYSSFAHKTLTNLFDQLGGISYVSKSSPFHELVSGIRHLISKKPFKCLKTLENLNSNKNSQIEIQKPEFSHSEQQIILCAIEGLSIKETAQKLHKSTSTISNQRISLMLKNECNMQELIRSYLYWYSEG